MSSTIPKPVGKRRIHPTAVIADKAIIEGSHDIEIGEHTVIQPYARVRSEAGNVTIGAYCTVAEAASIGMSENHSGDVVVGDYVEVETGVSIQSTSVGDCSKFDIRSSTLKHSTIGKGCKIGSKQVIAQGEHIADCTVVYGDHEMRLDQSLLKGDQFWEARRQHQREHVEVLRKLIPNAAAKFTT